jgi:hypothetical protein
VELFLKQTMGERDRAEAEGVLTRAKLTSAERVLTDVKAERDGHFDSFLRELEANMYYSEELTALNTKIQDSEALLNSAITAKDVMEYRITNLTGSVKDVIEDLAHTFDGVMATLRHELELISNIVVKREAPPPTDWELLEIAPQVKRPRRIVHLASGAEALTVTVQGSPNIVDEEE